MLIATLIDSGIASTWWTRYANKTAWSGHRNNPRTCWEVMRSMVNAFLIQSIKMTNVLVRPTKTVLTTVFARVPTSCPWNAPKIVGMWETTKISQIWTQKKPTIHQASTIPTNLQQASPAHVSVTLIQPDLLVTKNACHPNMGGARTWSTITACQIALAMIILMKIAFRISTSKDGPWILLASMNGKESASTTQLPGRPRWPPWFPAASSLSQSTTCERPPSPIHLSI